MDDVAAVASRRAKQTRLADYFASVGRAGDDEDLRRAVRFAGGRAFAATDERTTGVSGAIVAVAVTATWTVDRTALRAASIRAGDLGEAAAALVAPLLAMTGGGPDALALALTDLSRAFDALAGINTPDGKRRVLINLLARVRHPRELAYAIKVLLSDLRTGVKEGLLQAAVAEAFGVPIAAIQRAQFLLGNLDDVAVLARNGRLDDARFALFHPIQFMLATPKESPAALHAAFGGRSFWAEDKLDGIRAQIHKDAGGRVAIYSRTLDRVDESFPELVAAVGTVPGGFLLDGEIVACRAGAPAAFACLQPRLGRKRVPAGMLRDNPVAFVAFDLLYHDGDLLLDRPLHERRAWLGHALPLPLLGTDGLRPGALCRLPHVEVRDADDIATAFERARARDGEGLVLKDPDSPYAPGRRGQWWFKLKTHLPTLDCVVTAAEYGHGKRRGVLSDYTFAVWDRDPSAGGARLVNIGKAYTGLTDAEIAMLTDRFKRLAYADNGRVFQVTPEVVLEIAMDQVQRSTRHASGFALRFPRIKRIRDDKRPTDADRIERVQEIFASKANITDKSRASGAERARRRPSASGPSLFDAL